MQIITPASEKLLLLAHSQPIGHGQQYRRCTYTLACETAQGWRVLNTYTGQIIALTPEEYGQWCSLPRTYQPWMDELIKGLFIVEESFDEATEVREVSSFLHRMAASDAPTLYIIAPTTACNARCPYCYEADMRTVAMAGEVADATAAFITKHAPKRGVRLQWFGGEPLLAQSIIDSITRNIESAGVPITARMISNMHLFDEALVGKAVKRWHLDYVQTTLDGTEETYNETKTYIAADANESPYQRVLRNIGLLLDAGVQVKARLNVGAGNTESLLELTDVLSRRFGQQPRFSAYACALYNNCESYGFSHDEYARIKEGQEQVNRALCSCGILRDNLPTHLRDAACLADSPRAVLINPLGGITKCEHDVFSNEIGNVYEGMTTDGWRNYRYELPSFKNCDACPLFPVCKTYAYCPGVSPTCNARGRSEAIETYRTIIRNA